MESKTHFPKEVNPMERYNNDLLNEIRKQTKLLEQIAQLLKGTQPPNGVDQFVKNEPQRAGRARRNAK